MWSSIPSWSPAAARTLLTPDGVSILKTRLLPLATIVTPNVAEAAGLSGITMGSLRGTPVRPRAGLPRLGPKAVLINGGHIEGPEAVDLLFDGRVRRTGSAPRVTGGDVHGTGCTLASAIAAGLALGDDVPTAVQQAKRYVTAAIEHAIDHRSRRARTRTTSGECLYS